MVKLSAVNGCGVCGSLAMNAHLCKECERKLTDIVIQAGITHETDHGTQLCILDELDVQISRQSRAAARNGGRSAETPLPFDSRASKAHSLLADKLTHWARHYGAGVNVLAGPRRCADWLRNHLSLIILSVDSEVMYWSLDIANTHALTVIDRPESKDYIGICSAVTDVGMCEADLYAPQDHLMLICPQCDTSHDVRARRTIMLNAAEDVLLSGVDVARMVTLMGERVTAAQVYRWRFRGRLMVRGKTAEGHPLYRLGDVLTLVRRPLLQSI